MGYAVDNKFEVFLDKPRFDTVLREKGYGGYGGYKELYLRLASKYGLGIGYGSFMGLLGNDTTWRLIYAFAVCDFLSVNINDIFHLVEVTEEMKSNKRYRKNADKIIVKDVGDNIHEQSYS